MARNRAVYSLIFLASVVSLWLGDECFAGQTAYPHRGFYELSLKTGQTSLNPYTDVELQVTFKRPDGSQVTVDGFYDGGGIFKARAYCDAVGKWRWTSSSNLFDISSKSGQFEVEPSSLPGKLRLHKKDRRQFAYDNGQWFLHIGDTGYRYVTQTEPKWKEYIDQAARMGATKIRTWFCQGRSDVQILFSNDRKELNLEYWQEIDKRLQYAFEKYPRIIFKLIPYGEDTAELRRYEKGDEGAKLIAQYAQARFSALPNIHWCISNDREIVPGGKLTDRKVLRRTIDRIGKDMAAREPWGTLLTNHQSRFRGYDFVDAEWSDIIMLEDMDQTDGRIFKEYYGTRAEPMVLDEDRYEHWRNPKHDRYFFRRLMWASLLSGGHATYGGLRTYEPYDGNESGVMGYFDAVAAGKLERGGDDFIHIHKFFDDSGLTLVGMKPDDAMVGNDPAKFKCIHDDRVYIIYLANPDGAKPGEANVSSATPNVVVRLPEGRFAIEWFNPRSGKWKDGRTVSGGKQNLKAPGGSDWILLLRSQDPPSAAGPLRVHRQNPRYFTDGSGRAVLLTGSHTWANFQERGIEGQTPDFDYERYLDFMQERGHNFMRMWRWEHAQWMQFVPRETLIRYKPMAYMRTGPGTALDGKPKFDLGRFNQAYFDRLRERVVAAGERGIYVSVMMFQGFSVEQKGTKGVDPKKGNAWDGHPCNSKNNANGVNGDLNGDGEGAETHTLESPEIVKLHETYILKVVDTLNDLDNVLWEISNESHTNSIEWHYHMIRFIKQYEASKPKQHPVGMTSSPINNPPLFASPADWISPNGRNYLNNPLDTKGRKVIIVDNDHINPWNSDPQWIWKNLMRGNQFILMDNYMDFRTGLPENPDPKHDPARKAMGFARWLSERVDLASLTPQSDLTSTGYCLANPGVEYLAYRPQSDSKEFSAKLESGRYAVEWTDLTSGRVVKAKDLQVRGDAVVKAKDLQVGEYRFVPPVKNPSILHLKK
ncbi:MAG: apiosidase-like domain-containing protein [Planctomycetota bacterium]